MTATNFRPGQTWLATAPSNIALIKYMGKTEHTGNRPTNTSLSYTLNHLRTFVELELLGLAGESAVGLEANVKAGAGVSGDIWEPLKALSLGAIRLQDVDGKELMERGTHTRLTPIELSEKGRNRFLSHLAMLKKQFGFNGQFRVRSANDFPSDCGLASSASSFAALTRVTVQALADLTGQPKPSMRDQAELSRRGSGSSCRSFFTPWSAWSKDYADGVSGLGFEDLIHQVVVVNEKIKAVSSSDAHKRVASSLLFEGRPERAEMRAELLISAFRAQDWREAYEISWAEFWDMHSLFESSRPSFGYMTAGSLDVLTHVRQATWEKNGDGPLVTMDAGPNVHLMYRRNEAGKKAADEMQSYFQGKYLVFSSETGHGVRQASGHAHGAGI